MANSTFTRIGVYAGIAAIVLAYVGLTARGLGEAALPGPTAQKQPTPGGVAERPAVIRTLTIASGAVALWIALDVVVVSRMTSRDAMTLSLVRVLIGWGALLALGAMLSPGNQRLAAAAIVFGVTAAFVGLWIAALSSRKESGNRPVGGEPLEDMASRRA